MQEHCPIVQYFSTAQGSCYPFIAFVRRELYALHMLHCEVFITPPANVQINISKRHTCAQQSFTENYVFFLFVQQFEFSPILLLVKGKRKLVECTSQGGVNNAQ